MKPLLDVAGGLLDALLPQTCIGCESWIRTEDRGACPPCRGQIETLRELPACPRCARSMRPESIYDRGCARCEREQFWNIAGIVRVGPYVTPLREILTDLKFRTSERGVDWLATLLAEKLRHAPWFPSLGCFVPVPMHLLRRLQRPRDHADALARALGRQLDIPVRRAAVRRIKYKPSQIEAPTRNQRFEQVDGCFGPTKEPGVDGKTVCIIDNLLVSGATLCEVSRVLRRAGANRIYAAVVARSVMPGDFQADPEPLATATAPR